MATPWILAPATPRQWLPGLRPRRAATPVSTPAYRDPDTPAVRLTWSGAQGPAGRGHRGQAARPLQHRPERARSSRRGLQARQADRRPPGGHQARGANLFTCDLTDAMLTDADLTKANLDGTRAAAGQSPARQPRRRQPLRHHHRSGRSERCQPGRHPDHRLSARRQAGAAPTSGTPTSAPIRATSPWASCGRRSSEPT